MVNWKIGLIILLLVVLGAFGAAYYLKQKVGDIRPAVLPAPTAFLSKTPAKSVEPNQKSGTQLNFDLKVPAGFQIGAFAQGVTGARDLEFSPGGTLIATEMSQGKVVALPDKNNDGISDQTKVLLSGLNRPHGLAFYQGKLYVAEQTALKRYNFDENNLTASFDKKLLDLPDSTDHVTRSLLFDKTGRLYISIGSTCNVCSEPNPWFAAVLVTDSEGQNPRIFSKGLRNAVFLANDPKSDQIWVTEMGRDFLGDNTPADELNILQDNGDFGWPYCYDDKIHDSNFDPSNQHSCDNTLSPQFKIPAHSAPLGLAFINSAQFPSDWQNDLLVSYHGSWNRSVPTGYKVVHIKFKDGKPQSAEDFITGFLDGSQAFARPVDLIFDQQGSLYLSDDKSGYIFKIVKS